LISAGSPFIFFKRPISGTIMGFLLIFVILQIFTKFRRRRRL
jgi:TctA family transporter